MTERDYDIVLFGASGFVGSLVAAHLALTAGPGVRVALAGRALPRLAAVRRELPGAAAAWDLVRADATDVAGLRTLAARTRVLVTTVGPYDVHGREVVRAAAEEGTHYADLTGELLFVRWTLDEVDARARETGAKVVHSCGFDSIPSDLGVLLLAEQAAADGEGTLTDTTLVVRTMKGGLSGGTIDSGRQQAIAVHRDPALRRVLRDPYALSPSRGEEPADAHDGSRAMTGRLRALVPVEREPGSRRWSGPFVMADYNTRLVRLSNALTGWSYGRGFRYKEVSDLGSGPASPLLGVGLALGLGLLKKGLEWTPARVLLDRVLPEPGEGPSEQQRAKGRFEMEITSTTTSGARYRATVSASYDPGYNGTAVMLGQSALCLALDTDKLPERSGVLTPATAMGDALVERLRAQGFVLEAVRLQ